MEASGNTAGSRGAYAPVTMAISPADEKIPPKKSPSKQTGLCACTGRTKIIVAAIVIVVVIIIIIIAVVASKNNKGPPSSVMKNDTSMTTKAMMTSKMQVTTLAPTNTDPVEQTTVTPGMAAPQPYVLEGAVTVNETFPDHFDDSQDTDYQDYVAQFRNAIKTLLIQNEEIANVYNTTVMTLSQNGTRIQSDFTVALSSVGVNPVDLVCQFLKSRLQEARNTMSTTVLSEHVVWGYQLPC